MRRLLQDYCCVARLLTAQTIIQCPNCQNVFGKWGDLLPRYAAEKDDDGVLHLASLAD